MPAPKVRKNPKTEDEPFDLRSAQGKLIASLMAALADNAERAIMQSHTAEVAMGPACQ